MTFSNIKNKNSRNIDKHPFIMTFVIVLLLNVTVNITFAESVTNSSSELSYLESQIYSSHSIQSELALLEELQAELNHLEDISGWQIIGSASSGYTNERLTTGERSQYYPTRLSAGLSYPLFGKFMDEQSKLLDLQAEGDNRYLNIEISRRETLEKLRSSYIILWGAEQRLKLANAFLKQSGQSTKILEIRKEQGLLLPSDYYDFVTIKNRVTRELRTSQNTIAHAKEIIRLLTGVKIGRALTSAPTLPNITTNINQAMAEINQNPEIMLFQNMVDLQLKKARYASSDIKGNMTIQGFASSSDDVSTDGGYGGIVTFDIAMPINPFKANRSSNILTHRKLRRYQKELDFKVEEIKIETSERLIKLDTARARRAENISLLQAATSFLKEKLHRLAKLDGDVLAQYQQARYKYYRTATLAIESEIDTLLAANAVLRFHPSSTSERKNIIITNTSIIKPLINNSKSCDSIFSIKTQPDKKNKKKLIRMRISDLPFSPPPQKIIYLWKSNDFLKRNLSLNEIKSNKIKKILVSLDSSQLLNITTANGKINLINAISHYQKNNITISLLLGEASWILPENRSKLMEILRIANNFNFATVHLDMEPNQLDTKIYSLEYLKSQLLHTLQLATTTSQHPIEASFNPRLFASEDNEICLGCGIENIDLYRVVLMDYRTSSKDVSDQITQFAKTYPRIKFALAQSLEKSLSEKNSYAHKSLNIFNETILNFQNESSDNNWSGDIYIQDWDSYKQLINDNAIQ